MFVMIVGGGKAGSHLTSQLLSEGHQVRLIEVRPDIAERLKKDFPESVVCGDGSAPKVLEEAGIHQMQVLTALTGEDETNLVITTLGRFEFNIPRTIARVNNPKNTWLFNAEMGVDVGLNQTDMLTKLIKEEMSVGDMMTLMKLRKGDYAIVEEKLPKNSQILGIPLKDLPLPTTCVIAAVIRHGQVLVPRGNMLFEGGDEILAVVDDASRASLQILFSEKAINR
ncbi:MAG: TrkA family potassium uptake protein [Anaerolineales bacterium]|nr:TrkA family potassium uptake protein [Anaerolineales bacterium]